MFKQNTVISIKVGKNFLPDNNSIVKLPFGSEYSILIKNLNNSPINVKMYIDGNINGPEKGFIIKEKDYFEINSFLNTNNALKFINKSKELNEKRIENIEDSLIRFEVDILRENQNNLSFKDFDDLIKKTKINPNPFNKPWEFPRVDLNEHPFLPDKKNGLLGGDYNPYKQVFCTNSVTNYSNEGITVPGNKVEKKEINSFIESKYIKESSFCFIFKLEGTTDSFILEKEKKTCKVCEKKYKSKYNYCPIDGSYLN